VAALAQASEPSLVSEQSVHDDLLRLLFVCCDESIPLPSQLVFALKTLCGFDVPEIAQRLFTSEANVYKRLTRARDRLRALPIQTDALISQQYASRLPAVQQVIYQLFTEG
jgi:RNA polymerase sigma-70 factor (ECF subfamily)